MQDLNNQTAQFKSVFIRIESTKQIVPAFPVKTRCLCGEGRNLLVWCLKTNEAINISMSESH